VNHLADRQASSDASPERQSALDAQVRSRIQAELEQLRQEEENVRREIALALEKENLDREIASADSPGTLHGDVPYDHDKRNSAVILRDIEDIQSKIDKYRGRQASDITQDVKTSGQAVETCYR
jgi:altered-inheritance-of-mitochondria protein 13